MLNNKNGNPYLDAVFKKLKEAFEKTDVLSKTLTPETIDEYTKAAKDLKDALIDLAKLGANMVQGDGNIITVPIADDDEVRISVSSVRKYMTVDEISIFEANIKSWEEKNASDEDDYFYDDYESADDVVNPMRYGMNPMQLLSILQLLQLGTSPMPSVKASEIADDLAKLERKILSMEHSKNNVKEHNYQTRHKLAIAMEELDNVQKELAEKSKELDDLREEKKKADDELSANSQSFKEEISKLEKKVADLKREALDKENSFKNQLSNKDNLVNSKSSEIERLKKLQEVMESDYDKLVEKNKERVNFLEKEIESIKASKQYEIEKVRREETAKRGDVDELKQQLAAARNNYDKSQEYNNKLKAERDEKNKKITELENAQKTARDKAEKAKKEYVTELTALNEKINALIQEKQNLERLAYIDAKTRVMNSNAFNRDFKDKSIDKSLSVSMIGICGVKKINAQFGREAGDNLIAIVANKLAEYFDVKSIYRVIGDQFVVIHEGSEYSKVNFALTDIQKELVMSDINVVFGVASGEYCKTHGELLNTAEKSMENMKREKERIFEPLNDAKRESLSKAEEVPINTSHDINSSIADGLSNLEEEE